MKKRVLVGGCFNKIHQGHIYFLTEAKKKGNHLSVILTHDDNNKKEYAIDYEKRKLNLEKLKIADEIVKGDIHDFKKLVDRLKPDIIVLGHDQKMPAKDIFNKKIEHIKKYKNYSTKNMNDYKLFIKEVKDFPKKGIVFQDLTPLIEDKTMFKASIQEMAEHYKEKIDKIVGIESRGFLFAAPLAVALNTGLVMARKKGKLPREFAREYHLLEYGTTALDMHLDSIKEGEKILIVDDLLATGGTVSAAIKLVEKLKGDIIGLCFLIEVESFKARKKFKYPVYSLIKYEV